MTFPTITFKHTNVEPDYALQALIAEKLASLQKYTVGARAVRIEVELEKLTITHTNDVYRVEVNVWRGDTLARAEATGSTFEKAVDVVRDNITTELERAHDKRVNVMRRTARKFKEIMRWGG